MDLTHRADVSTVTRYCVWYLCVEDIIEKKVDGILNRSALLFGSRLYGAYGYRLLCIILKLVAKRLFLWITRKYTYSLYWIIINDPRAVARFRLKYYMDKVLFNFVYNLYLYLIKLFLFMRFTIIVLTPLIVPGHFLSYQIYSIYVNLCLAFVSMLFFSLLYTSIVTFIAYNMQLCIVSYFLGDHSIFGLQCA